MSHFWRYSFKRLLLNLPMSLIWALSAGMPSRAAVESSQVAFYLDKVKPILAENCYRCHGASQQKHNLRLDTAEMIRKGGETGPAVIPGQPENSLLIQAVKGTHEKISQMPYKKQPLGEEQIALLEEWIRQGAHGPQNEEPQSEVHWSFIPPKRPALPATAQQISPVDAFVHARLAKSGIQPSPEADRVTLLRRLSLDLIGLPPSPAEIEDFLHDTRPDAYERQVERLLASPHYGERWGRWWLDAARYGDSNGYSIDAPRQIWKYRDWVVAALNRDMPFDQFAIDQLAGDLLPNPTLEQKIATGFNRNTQINQEGGIDPEQFRVESVVDRVNTFGTVFLGLTIACAQCHDHKFDPVSHKEYYQLYAFFNSTVEDGHGRGTPGGMLEIPGEFEDAEALQKDLQEAREELERYLDTQGSAVKQWEESLQAEAREKLKPEIREALEVAWSERSLEQKRNSYAAFKAEDPEFKSRNTKLTRLEKREPKPVTTLVMEELKEPRESFLFIKGDFTRPSTKVSPGVPAILHKWNSAEPMRNRLDLAGWVVSPENPLMARVIANRVWQQYFGRGLVETENDFGTQGSLPTHPDLLDWLAVEFMQPSSGSASAWSLKHLHRLIVSSATYKQSSNARPDLAVADPTNKLLARQNRVRLDAEIIRDVALAASGLLTPEIGGPPVFPPQPDGVMALGQVRRAWNASTGPNRYRRGLYTHWWRATPHPALAVFDAPDGFSTCTRRIRSNTPLQALTLLNDQQFFEFAKAFGERLLQEAESDQERIAAAFRLAVGRQPQPREISRVNQLLAQVKQEGAGELEAWSTVARVMLNLDETITRE